MHPDEFSLKCLKAFVLPVTLIVGCACLVILVLATDLIKKGDLVLGIFGVVGFIAFLSIIISMAIFCIKKIDVKIDSLQDGCSAAPS